MLRRPAPADARPRETPPLPLLARSDPDRLQLASSATDRTTQAETAAVPSSWTQERPRRRHVVTGAPAGPVGSIGLLPLVVVVLVGAQRRTAVARAEGRSASGREPGARPAERSEAGGLDDVGKVLPHS